MVRYWMILSWIDGRSEKSEHKIFYQIRLKKKHLQPIQLRLWRVKRVRPINGLNHSHCLSFLSTSKINTWFNMLILTFASKASLFFQKMPIIEKDFSRTNLIFQSWSTGCDNWKCPFQNFENSLLCYFISNRNGKIEKFRFSQMLF